LTITYNVFLWLNLSYKTSQLMLYKEIIAVCSHIRTKHINTLCGQNVELLNVKLVVHNNNHWHVEVYALKGQ